jgi:hypothetical protein
MTKDNGLGVAIFREFPFGVREHLQLKTITFQLIPRTETIKGIRVRNLLQFTANVSLFWWLKSTFWGVRNDGYPFFIQ